MLLLLVLGCFDLFVNLSGMHLSHYSVLVVVLDVLSDWGPLARNMSLHNHHACPKPLAIIYHSLEFK
jgi:hypothetical protein